MKRWLLTIRNVHGKVMHEEQFWFRRNAETIGRFYAEPLPVRATSVTAHGHRRDGALLQLLTFEVTRRRRSQ